MRKNSAWSKIMRLDRGGTYHHACNGLMEMPADIKTDAALLKKLADCVKAQVSEEQLHKQRVTFIYGRLPAGSGITVAQIEAALAKADGEAR
jgi:hypothetical protein